VEKATGKKKSIPKPFNASAVSEVATHYPLVGLPVYEKSQRGGWASPSIALKP
jgi:hypothetical protein